MVKRNRFVEHIFGFFVNIQNTQKIIKKDAASIHGSDFNSNDEY